MELEAEEFIECLELTVTEAWKIRMRREMQTMKAWLAKFQMEVKTIRNICLEILC